MQVPQKLLLLNVSYQITAFIFFSCTIFNHLQELITLANGQNKLD